MKKNLLSKKRNRDSNKTLEVPVEIFHRQFNFNKLYNIIADTDCYFCKKETIDEKGDTYRCNICFKSYHSICYKSVGESFECSKCYFCKLA